MKFSLLILLFAVPAMAGGITVGNGGWGVRCDGTHSVRLLDFVEGRWESGGTPDLGAPDLTIQEKLGLAFQRLSARFEVSPAELEEIRDQSAEFLDHSLQPWTRDGHWYEGIQNVYPIDPDSPELSSAILNRLASANCHLVPLAMRRPDPLEDPNTGGQKLCGLFDSCFFRDEFVWQNMDSDQRAGLALHEALWTHRHLWYRGNPFPVRDLRKFVVELCRKR